MFSAPVLGAKAGAYYGPDSITRQEHTLGAGGWWESSPSAELYTRPEGPSHSAVGESHKVPEYLYHVVAAASPTRQYTFYRSQAEARNKLEEYKRSNRAWVLPSSFEEIPGCTKSLEIQGLPKSHRLFPFRQISPFSHLHPAGDVGHSFGHSHVVSGRRRVAGAGWREGTCCGPVGPPRCRCGW